MPYKDRYNLGDVQTINQTTLSSATEKYLNRYVAFYLPGRLSDYDTKITVRAAFDLFTSDFAASHTEYIRETWKEDLELNFPDPAKKHPYQKYKKRFLSSVLFSGVAHRSAKGQYESISGLVPFDIDQGRPELLRAFFNDPLPCLLFRAFSVSGAPNGFGLFATTATNKEEYEAFRKGITAKLKTEYNLTCTAPDFARIRYISHDPDAWINPDLVPLRLSDLPKLDSLHFNDLPDIKKKTRKKTIEKVGTSTMAKATTIAEQQNEQIADEINEKDWRTFCTRFAQLHGLEFTPGQRHHFINYFSIAANLLGIHSRDCNKYLRSKYSGIDPDSNAITYPYTEYETSFKKWHWRLKVSLPDVITPAPGQKWVSDVLQDYNLKSCYLGSPTGSGKSRWIAGFKKALIVTPYAGLSSKTGKELQRLCPDESVFTLTQYDNIGITRDDLKADLACADKVVTTMRGLSRVVDNMKVCGLILADWTFFVDEAHNLTNGAGNWMPEQINDVFEAIPFFKEYKLLSGTPLFLEHPVLKDCKRVSIDLPYQKLIGRIVEAKQPFKAIAELINKEIEKGRYPVVLFRNKGRERDSIEKHLKALNIKPFIVSADDGGEDKIDFFRHGKFPCQDKYGCILWTSIGSEGFDWFEDLKFSFIVLDSLQGHPASAIQQANRPREPKYTPHLILVTRKRDKETPYRSSINHFEREQYHGLLDKANQLCRVMNCEQDFHNQYPRGLGNIERLFTKKYDVGYTKKHRPDHSSINHEVSRLASIELWGNVDSLKHYLSAFGVVFDVETLEAEQNEVKAPEINREAQNRKMKSLVREFCDTTLERYRFKSRYTDTFIKSQPLELRPFARKAIKHIDGVRKHFKGSVQAPGALFDPIWDKLQADENTIVQIDRFVALECIAFCLEYEPYNARLFKLYNAIFADQDEQKTLFEIASHVNKCHTDLSLKVQIKEIAGQTAKQMVKRIFQRCKTLGILQDTGQTTRRNDKRCSLYYLLPPDGKHTDEIIKQYQFYEEHIIDKTYE